MHVPTAQDEYNHYVLEACNKIIFKKQFFNIKKLKRWRFLLDMTVHSSNSRYLHETGRFQGWAREKDINFLLPLFLFFLPRQLNWCAEGSLHKLMRADFMHLFPVFYLVMSHW